MTNYSTITHKYAFLWNKYRPAILKQMVDSVDGPKTYNLSKHEFHNVNTNEKGGYAFILRVFKSKSETDIRKSVLAKDLLLILQNSGKATELTETALYQFTLDKSFQLTVEREEVELEEEVVEGEGTSEDVKIDEGKS